MPKTVARHNTDTYFFGGGCRGETKKHLRLSPVRDSKSLRKPVPRQWKCRVGSGSATRKTLINQVERLRFHAEMSTGAMDLQATMKTQASRPHGRPARSYSLLSRASGPNVSAAKSDKVQRSMMSKLAGWPCLFQV